MYIFIYFKNYTFLSKLVVISLSPKLYYIVPVKCNLTIH